MCDEEEQVTKKRAHGPVAGRASLKYLLLLGSLTDDFENERSGRELPAERRT